MGSLHVGGTNLTAAAAVLALIAGRREPTLITTGSTRSE